MPQCDVYYSNLIQFNTTYWMIKWNRKNLKISGKISKKPRKEWPGFSVSPLRQFGVMNRAGEPYPFMPNVKYYFWQQKKRKFLNR